MGKYNKEELEELIINENKSYEEIGRLFNVSGVAIKKTAIRLGIELPNRRTKNVSETFNKGISRINKEEGFCLNCKNKFIIYSTKCNKYCSIKCQHEYQHKELYEKFLKGDNFFQRVNYNPRIFKPNILKEQDGKCLICSCETKHNGKELIFVLDHIDGDASNNRRENLRLICSNCDSQLDTYKSKNKNGTIHYYRYHKENKSKS